MIEANKNELFPITVSLVDEGLAELVIGQEVLYDIRYINDMPLSPPISGSLDESSVVNGIYKTEISIPVSGTYICYATCSGFFAGTEDIVINEESIIEVTKSNRTHNTSIIDVPRITVSGSETASQIARNVPVGKTDYIISIIKHDNDAGWGNPTASGVVFAHYRTNNDSLPYMMGGEF